VEAMWEIERLLELTDIRVCLDTGHLLLGWGDPVAAVRDWGARINHVHLKDAHSAVLERIMHEGASLDAIWEREAFCALGQGDVDLAGVVGVLLERRYSGWIVVEQDVVLEPEEPPARTAADQKSNRAYLRELGV
jgi:inosose dehydratase